MNAGLFSNFPPVKGYRWFNMAILIVSPALAIYGLLTGQPYNLKTLIFACFYYLFSVIGITAGYHRLWSHRSYTASFPLQYFLILAGTSAVQGSCYWWARTHRAHHRHTDTDLDPYNSTRGLLWTHIGWIIVKSELHSGNADISDLRRDPLIQWQHRWYFLLQAVFGHIIPTILPGKLWGDWKGGVCIAGALRLTLAHHSIFAVNSLAHYLGETPYDDKLTPRDSLITAILTLGEGYHNFHHQFPTDYRSAFHWYQYDPTKWFITICTFLGFAKNLRVFPTNEIEKGALSMKLKELKAIQDRLHWPKGKDKLQVISWESFQEQSKARKLILISGFIHDISTFMDQHPGGKELLGSSIGKDMTAAFFGGIYSHSNAAHNLLAMKRVGILLGGVEHTPKEYIITPAEQLYITDKSD
ncbi:hypothetical protein M422DRAFT_181218 [Sphaerobolus stellatus SS14]|uniref:Acyl-CoA desaturase n=1 Tax=Sphaerobolus stellatus (strain SS14) TaxID=990650 RepID=A0A0C9VBY7_SPHS4|nr:hypothetical protein M422DRAFT_181218 [Sphaerobolus stellatus SS14]